jgi:RNA polymerase sigma-70 factor (ECF subfamily)
VESYTRGETANEGHVIDSDRDIIDAVRNGNSRRYSVLVDRHKDRAMTLAVRLVGERSEAEELVQDAFLRAFRSLDTFRGEAKFSTWFYRILYNVCMTRVRRRHVLPVQDLPGDAASGGGEWADAGPDVQERLETDEVREMLLEEMLRLPEAFRVALTLFYVQELKYEEMTVVLQVPLGTVKTNLSRGRTLLREKILERMKDEVRSL